MPAPHPAHKRALLIGINEYPNLSTSAQLDGCVNDVRLMAGLLRDKYGFPDENVTVLTDGEATRDGILAALDGLAERVGADDVVVVHYAGHGSQVTDVDGDEPDGLDETIVPYDAVRGSGANVDVTDDEIHGWIERVAARTPYLTLLFDCCHSGTVTRDDFGAKARSLPPDLRPAPALGRAPARTTTRGAARAEGPSGWLPLSKRYVLIAGCRDEECAYEYRDAESGAAYGSLTFFLARALAAAPPGTTYRDVYERVRPLVTAHASRQHPQMEGALDREVFGVRDVEPMRYAAVVGREGGAVTLAAGAAHGLTAGSLWDAYPAGTKTTDGAAPLGRLRVTSVGAVASMAEVVEEAEGGAVGVGARAVEAAHDWGGLVLRVALAADAALLADAVEGSGLLARVGPDESADVRAALLPARADGGGAVPQLGPLAGPTWAVVGADGRLVMPPQAASAPDAAQTVLDNLNKLARFRHALALDNPDSALRDAVDVTLKRLDGNGAWAEAEPEEAGGEVVFEEGERVAFTVANRHTAPVYVYALDFGLAGAIRLFTVAGANDALAPGREQSVGLDRPLVLRFPEAFPFVQEPGEGAPTEGAETLRVFVTTEPTDFSSLLQAGVRSAGAARRSSLVQVLDKAFHGVPTRDMGFADGPADDADWAVVSRSFVVRRGRGGVALDAAGGAVDLGAVTLRTAGLDGTARVLPAPAFSARTRSVELATGDLEAVLEREHVETQRTVEIEGARTRGPGAEAAIEVEVPSVEGQGQLLLYTDESGVTTWQVAEDVRAGGAAARSVGGTRTFVVRRAGPAPAGAPAARGIIGAVGKKLLKLLVFPLLDPVVGAVSAGYAGRWEARHRPYGLRPFAPDGFRAPAAPLGPDDWRRLGAGRSLLFVHGTFSRAHAAFGGLAPEALAELSRRYGGRVFAFDHPTLSDNPAENVAWLVDRLPDDAALDLDVVCHSRGGLVSRVLAEQQGTLSLGARSLRVGSVVFVAAPNAGTRLADPEHMGDFVDTYTNLLNFVPGNPVTDVLEGVVTVAKQLAVGALGGLSGLQSMRPGGDFQRWLNAEGGRGGTTYYALGADFTPREPGFRAWAKDRLMDAVFGAENDLVVPTAGVYGANGSSLFPIEERHVFPASAGVAHSSFFQAPAAQGALLKWLQG